MHSSVRSNRSSMARVVPLSTTATTISARPVARARHAPDARHGHAFEFVDYHPVDCRPGPAADGGDAPQSSSGAMPPGSARPGTWCSRSSGPSSIAVSLPPQTAPVSMA